MIEMWIERRAGRASRSSTPPDANASDLGGHDKVSSSYTEDINCGEKEGMAGNIECTQLEAKRDNQASR